MTGVYAGVDSPRMKPPPISKRIWPPSASMDREPDNQNDREAGSGRPDARTAEKLEELRRELAPCARAAGWETEEDIFRDVS